MLISPTKGAFDWEILIVDLRISNRKQNLSRFSLIKILPNIDFQLVTSTTKSVFRFCVRFEIRRSTPEVKVERTTSRHSYQSFPRDFQPTYFNRRFAKIGAMEDYVNIPKRLILQLMSNENGLSSLSNLPPNIQTVVENCTMTIREIGISAGIRAREETSSNTSSTVNSLPATSGVTEGMVISYY